MLALAVRRRWVGAIGLGAATAATASVFACQQIAGIPSDPPVPTAVNACGLPYGTNACAACVATSCCSESSACAANSACSAYEECLGKSDGDWQVRSQCALDNPVGGSTEVSPLSACLATNCTSECGLTCGGLAANYAVPDHAGMCQECVTGSSFCAAEQACASSAACDAMLRCRLACETNDCADGCLLASDAGTDDLFTSFREVFHGACSTPCATGEDWTCVGKVSWPGIKSDTTTFVLDVDDYLTGSALLGVNVSVCDSLDVNCDHPLADGGTDDAGRVVMQVPNQREQLNPTLGLNGYVQYMSPSTALDGAIVPERWYWGFPLSESALEEISEAPFLSGTVSPIKPVEQQELATDLGILLDPMLGLVSVDVGDCRGYAAPNVQVTTNVSGSSMSVVYGTSSTAQATDSTGLVTFFNVPPGNVDLTAAPVALGGTASSHMSVTVRAGSITAVTMLPTP